MPTIFREGIVSQKHRKKPAFAAAKIQDALGASLAQCSKDRAQALLIQADAIFEDDLFGGVLFGDFVGVFFPFGKASERFAHEAMLVFQVAASDFVALGMVGKPAFAAAQELLDFVLADPIVFFIIKNRQQDVEMLQDILQTLFRHESDSPITAFTPLRKFFIQRMTIRGYCVTERLKQAMKKGFSSATGEDRDADFQRDFRIG